VRKPNKVFVYGTLKSGNTTRGMQYFEGAEFLGDAVTSDNLFDIVDLGSFPAVTQGKFKIKGEVYEVDEETGEYLDAIEGYPNFYNRKVISVNVASAKIQAWVYFIDKVQIENYRYTEVEADGDTKEWN
jgi:gamma-glutamylcyclotransferase (GGCT)/AIG2-like uncharacterized protein YtfP